MSPSFTDTVHGHKCPVESPTWRRRGPTLPSPLPEQRQTPAHGGRSDSHETTGTEPPAPTTNRRQRPNTEAGAPPELSGGGAGGTTVVPSSSTGRQGLSRALAYLPDDCSAVTALSPGAFSFRTEGTGTKGRHHTQLAFLSGAAPAADTAPGGAGSAPQHPGGSARPSPRPQTCLSPPIPQKCLLVTQAMFPDTAFRHPVSRNA